MLELKAIRVSYGHAVAIWDLSLTLNQGELMVVVGPNGAGKSTLINAIAGVHPAHAGTLCLDGENLLTLRAHHYCDRGIALVPEGRRLFVNMSVRDNLELGGYRRAARAARSSTLEQVCELFPVLKEKLAQPAGTLSGGQQQMVAIGRALMAQPRLLLLDEPSLGLAPSVVIDMFNAIRAIHAQGIAVLLVEQNVAMALDIAQRAAVLEEGRIVASGSPQALMNQPELLRAYLGVETESE